MIKMELSRNPNPARGVLLLLILTLAGLFPTQILSADGESGPETASPITITGDFKSAIVIDAETGLVLVAANETKRRQPASMLKMMTELIVLEHVAEDDMKLEDKIKVSAKASKIVHSSFGYGHSRQLS